MESIFQNLGNGFAEMLNFQTLLIMVGGIVLGIVAGAIPGLGSIMVMGLMLPLSYTMSTANSILMLVCIFKGATMGGSFSSILLNVPGTASAAATCFDGYPLARNGQSRKALEASILSSGLGDLTSDIILVFGVVFLARAALSLGSPEKFLVLLFALVLAGVLVGKSIWKGLIAIALGLLIGTVGLDMSSGLPRLGVMKELGVLDSLDSTAVLVGLLALSEIITSVSELRKNAKNKISLTPLQILGKHLDRKDCKESLKAFFSGTAVGTVFGALPGLGSTAASFTGYAIAKILYKGKTKRGVKFGEGAVPGVVSCESANSAVSGANLIPLLTLGIPGDAAAALLLSSFMIHGVTPGPSIVTTQAPLIYMIFAGFLVANFLNILFGFIVTKPISLLLRSKLNIVYPIVTLICMAGIYSTNSRILDVGVFIFMGVIGYLFKKMSVPLAPIAIGFVLAKNLEQYFRQSLSVSKGNFGIFFSSPASIVLVVLIVGLLAWIIVNGIRSNKESKKREENIHETN